MYLKGGLYKVTAWWFGEPKRQPSILRVPAVYLNSAEGSILPFLPYRQSISYMPARVAFGFEPRPSQRSIRLDAYSKGNLFSLWRPG
jgi:hypothetical protein